MNEKPPEVVAGEEYLSSGEWVPGPSLMRTMGEKIPPGKAERYAQDNLTNPSAFSRNKKIEMGRKHIVQERVAYRLKSGVWQTRPATLGRRHWLGFETWEVRARYPGALTIQEAAEVLAKERPDLNMTSAKLLRWIARGWLPAPRKPAKGQWVIERSQMAVFLKVASAAPTKAGRWAVEPSSIWAPKEEMTRVCPHCGEKVLLMVDIGAINSPSQDSADVDDAEMEPEDDDLSGSHPFDGDESDVPEA